MRKIKSALRITHYALRITHYTHDYPQDRPWPPGERRLSLFRAPQRGVERGLGAPSGHQPSVLRPVHVADAGRLFSDDVAMAAPAGSAEDPQLANGNPGRTEVERDTRICQP